MIRLTALWLVIGFLSVYAWRDWYKAVCGLVCLMAVIEHPDMPKTLFGVQGLNPWNIALLSVMSAWLAARSEERLQWDLPKWLTAFMGLYGTLIIVSFLRLVKDLPRLEVEETYLSVTSEYLVNSLKWVMPAVMIYDGCRNETRLRMAMWSLLSVYLLLAVQTIRWMYSFAGLGGEELQLMALKVLPKEVGYHRVNLSAMFAGAAWAMVAARGMLPKGLNWTVAAYGASLIVLIGQALTGGRTGYATWALLGLVLAALRWRKHLLLAPAVALMIVTLVPAVAQRMSQGFTEESRDRSRTVEEGSQDLRVSGTDVDLYTVTSGRTLIWPYVWKKIWESPVVGHGRQAMIRTGVTAELRDRFGEFEAFPHPHNAYLEWLIDNGWLGLAIIVPIYVYILWTAASLFRDRRASGYGAIGGMALSLVGAILIAGTGSQTFYPREGSVAMWCAVALVMRLAVERKAVDVELAQTPARPAPVPRPIAPTSRDVALPGTVAVAARRGRR